MSDDHCKISGGAPEIDLQRRLRQRCAQHLTPIDARFPLAAVESSLPARFEAMRQRDPDAIAVVSRQGQITYRQLSESSNALAGHLLRLGISLGGPVALLSAQGPECCVGILGVLKTGSAVAPLDPVQTDVRLTGIISEVGASVLVCHPSQLSRARTLAGSQPVVAIDLADQSNDEPESAGSIRPDSPAFIIFTSGSTGRPKGIVRSHRAQLHAARQFADLFGVAPTDRWSGLHSPGWTSGMSDVAAALMTGAALCAWSPHLDGLHGLAEWINRSGVTHVSWTPSAMCGLIAASPADSRLAGVRLVCLGSERLFTPDARRIMGFLPRDCVLANRLGSSEGGNYRYYFFDCGTPLPEAVIPAGYECADRPIRVIDEAGRDCPAGVTGEIVVRSPYLASGYWNQPELTASRFPLVDGVREFLTGDVGRLADDGCLELIGRRDSQVKIRGQRVEPGELEQVLRQFDGIEEAAVVVRDPTSPEPWLAAYYVTGNGQDQTSALRAALVERLPAYLVPRTITRVPKLPRNTNHKVDQAALIALAPAATDAAVGDHHASPLERRLAAYWQEVLEVPAIGPTDDFFVLGGDSLKGMRMLARLADYIDEPPSVLQLFEAATIREFADLLRRDYPLAIAQLESVSGDALSAPETVP
ncbi:MAG: non-ribosomal peptide synthetase [Planctomycetaceae bacterium]|nr:non-ribosomal peptide synthetase [Planctomycetaceae bacterium]